MRWRCGRSAQRHRARAGCEGDEEGGEQEEARSGRRRGWGARGSKIRRKQDLDGAMASGRCSQGCSSLDAYRGALRARGTSSMMTERGSKVGMMSRRRRMAAL
eukprot:2133301-Rhodomonas_salina.1